MGKKILLIGSDSFIARYFIKEKGAGFDVRGASIVYSGLENELVLDDLFALAETDFEGVDAVVNFAAIVHRPQITDHAEYDRVNHQLPVQLARKAADAGVKHFVQMSTIAVYGPAERISSSTPFAPESPYAESKLKADLELLDLSSSDFGVSLLRPSMVYGGGVSPGNMLKLIKLCDRPLPLPFRGVDNSRQFAYAGLVAEALERIILKRETGMFLLADSHPVSTGKLVSIIRSELGRPQRQFRLPVAARRIFEKTKPSLYRKLFGSLLIDIGDTYNRLGLEGGCDNVAKGISEMVESLRRL